MSALPVAAAPDAVRWFPVLRSEELIARHIAEIMLLGQDIALWRDDAGAANAWENRCPHRGVRFSVGFNTGKDLRCLYHGWLFGSGSGQCHFIPAHPTQKPASTIRATTFGVAEAQGYVWVRLAGADAPLPQLSPGAAAAGTLRSIFMWAPAPVVIEALGAGYELQPGVPVRPVALDEYTLLAGGGEHPAQLLFHVQPVDAQRSVVHATLSGAPAGIETLRYHNAQLTALRRTLGMPQ